MPRAFRNGKSEEADSPQRRPTGVPTNLPSAHHVPKGVRRADPSARPPNADICDKYVKTPGDSSLRREVLTQTNKLIVDRNWREGKACLEEMMQAGLEPTTITYNSLIAACGKAGQLEEALKIFQQMPSPKVDISTINNLMAACKKTKNSKAVQEIFDQRPAHVHPNVITLNTLMSAYVNDGNTLKAQEIFKQMGDAHNVAPNVITFNTLMSAYAYDGNTGMARNILNLMKAASVRPDVYTFNTLISTYGNVAAIDRVTEVVAQMKAARIEPNVSTFNALISAHGNAGDAVEALKIFKERMPAAKVAPDVVTFNALISACRKHPAKTQEVFDNMLAKDIRPNLATFQALISTCGEETDLTRMKQIIDQVKNAGIQPIVDIFTAFISAYGNAGNVAMLQEVFDEMQVEEIKPTVVTVNAGITAWGKCKMWEKAQEIFEKRPASIQPNTTTFRALVVACSKGGRADWALHYFEAMKQNGFTPEKLTFNALISACETAERIDASQAILQEAVKRGIYREELGYDSASNVLNFHVGSVMVNPSDSGEHEKTVSALVARALFRHHLKEANINDDTVFVVGHHGRDLVRVEVEKCIQNWDRNPDHDLDQVGQINPGRLRSKPR